MSSYTFCQVAREGRLLIVTINRPDVMNALHRPASLELERVFDAFAADPGLWVAILTGAGERAFCAGNDLKYQAAGNDTALPPSGFGGLTARFGLTKPVIAAVNGLAMGGGFELALACDLLIAVEGAFFALPEPKVGLMAAAGGAQRLVRQIPLKLAMGMMLTGEHVDARRALELGLVNEVVPAAELGAAATRFAERILECSPLSVRATKQAALASLDRPLPESIGVQQYPAVLELFRSEDCREGPLAFAQKRKPEWKGR